MTRPTGEDEMSDMTDERAAEVLRDAISEGRCERERADPLGADDWEADCNAAIAHIEARLRSQPPAEAQLYSEEYSDAENVAPSAPVGVEE